VYGRGVTNLRTYGEGCAVAHGLELIGERWSLLIVRELLLGPKRFNTLQAGMRQASANIVSQRLRQLDECGVVRRRKLGAPANAWVWELTAWGYELEPIIMALGSWASASPGLDREGWYSPDALMLHLKARFDPGAGATAGRYEVRMEDDSYAIEVEGAAIRIARGESGRADTVIQSDLVTLTDIVNRRVTPAHAIKSGHLQVTGDKRAAGLLLTGR
jgi:DNA-binding HxlR family transcriptional regulator